MNIPKEKPFQNMGLLTSLKRSATHFEIITDNIIGKPKVIFPRASIKITVKLIVILITPPRLAAAPIIANLE